MQLAIVLGKSIDVQGVIADQVKQPIEIYIRVRAWLVSLAFI